ncbi:MAG TPA: SDR family NAD(P)-dependent oxidoreductase [Actinoplanes sp.]|nr:SDR family NAD(P)-dependent oxidoreductase [Actinoplanes sp.]
MAERTDTAPVALVTGASLGLGLALTRQLVHDGWRVIADARNGDRLRAALHPLGDAATAIPGDVADAAHRADLAAAVRSAGRLDLYIANASALGPTPLPPLAAYPPGDLTAVLAVNAVAPLAVLQDVLPLVRSGGGTVVTISSDAATEAYPGWGGYGMAKAALDRMAAVLAVEEPGLAVYAVDPGDMATAMHAAADPDADPAELADPAEVAAALLAALATRPPSGRYRLADLVPAGRRPA